MNTNQYLVKSVAWNGLLRTDWLSLPKIYAATGQFSTLSGPNTVYFMSNPVESNNWKVNPNYETGSAETLQGFLGILR